MLPFTIEFSSETSRLKRIQQGFGQLTLQYLCIFDRTRPFVFFQFTQTDIMEAADQANLVLQLPRFKFEGRNRQEFRRNWPQIARHYGIQGVVDGTSQRPVLGDDNAEAVAAWDVLNQLALDKLKYYVTDSVHAIVWKGQDDLTARDYYSRMSTCC